MLRHLGPPLGREQVESTLSEPSRQRRAAMAKRRSGEFIRGPIPLDWIVAAAGLGGSSLKLGLALWFRRGIEGSDSIQLRPATTKRFGIGRKAAYRALAALEGAGLIVVERRVGRTSRIRLIDRGSETESRSLA